MLYSSQLNRRSMLQSAGAGFAWLAANGMAAEVNAA